MTEDATPSLRQGEAIDGELWTLVYGQLKALARQVLRGRRRPVGPQTTTLVHEAYLRLAGDGLQGFTDHRHFFAVAARAMRYVLVDEARRRFASKRGSGQQAVTFEEACQNDLRDPLSHCAEEILAVHQALERLAEINPRSVELVELRYFSGFTVDEAAEALGVSRPTVVRDWQATRIWLHGVLAEQSHSAGDGLEAR